MINFPTCKINLGLHILSKRDDGFHNIESVLLELPFTDVLEITEATEDGFESAGLTIPGAGNLCIDAVNALRKKVNFPSVHIHLLKHIPMGGGLGGGSADAAFTLRLINKQFELQLTDNELEKIAASLGSDCPFFVRGGAQLATGTGEVLTPIALDLSGYQLILINNGIHVPTKDAYAGVTVNPNREPLQALINLPIEQWKKFIVNDFEISVFEKHPSLKDLKQELYDKGAVYAAMTGSGSTLFGIFKQKPEDAVFSQSLKLEKWIQL